MSNAENEEGFSPEFKALLSLSKGESSIAFGGDTLDADVKPRLYPAAMLSPRPAVPRGGGQGGHLIPKWRRPRQAFDIPSTMPGWPELMAMAN